MTTKSIVLGLVAMMLGFALGFGIYGSTHDHPQPAPLIISLVFSPILFFYALLSPFGLIGVVGIVLASLRNRKPSLRHLYVMLSVVFLYFFLVGYLPSALKLGMPSLFIPAF